MGPTRVEVEPLVVEDLGMKAGTSVASTRSLRRVAAAARRSSCEAR